MGNSTNQVSQLTIEEIRKYQNSSVIVEKSESDDETQARKIRERLSSLSDDSFPVKDAELKNRLTIALEWLNRKIQEEVTVDLIDKVIAGVPEHLHIVDFTERIILDEKEYFLVSNNFIFTPKKLVQKLKLIRWFE